MALALLGPLGPLGAVSVPARAQTSVPPVSTGSGRPTAGGADDAYATLRPPADDGHLHVVLATPKGQLRSVRQASELRWVFDRPVIALSTIAARSVDGSIAANPEKSVRIAPAVRGSFRWASTRVLVFSPTDRLPVSTHISVTLSSLTALDGTTLAVPVDSSFDTPRVACRQYDTDAAWNSGRSSGSILVTCNQPVEGADVASHTTVVFQHALDGLGAYTPSAGDLAVMRASDPTGVALLESRLRELGDKTTSQRTVTVLRSGRCPNQGTGRAVCHWLRLAAAKATGSTRTGGTDLPLESDYQVRFADGITSKSGPLRSVAMPPQSGHTTTVPLISVGCRVDCDPDGGLGLSIRGDVTPKQLSGEIKVTLLGTDGKSTKSVTYRSSGADDAEDPLSLNWASLAPGARYRVELDPSITDSNGRRLGYRSVTTFTLGHRRAYLNLPNGEYVTAATEKTLTVPVRNVKAVEMTVRAVSAQEALRIMSAARDGNLSDTALPGDAKHVVLPTASSELDNATGLEIALPSTGQDGVYLVALKAVEFAPSSTYDTKFEWQVALIQRGERGITVKRSPTDVLVAVSSFTTGRALTGAKGDLVQLAVFANDHRTSRVYWSGATDASGFAHAPAPDCLECEVVALVTTPNGQGLVYARSSWGIGGGPRVFDEGVQPVAPDDAQPATGVAPGLAAAQPDVPAVPALPPGRRFVGSLFTDRGVYKGGEEVRARGRIRVEVPRGLELPGAALLARTDVRVSDDAGAVVWQGAVNVDARGGFDAVFTLPVTARQGTYTVAALGGQVATTFLSTTYRRPDFKVDVAVGRERYVPGETVTGSSTGAYLFGAPMSDLAAKWVATATPTYVDPTAGHPELGLRGYTWSYVCIWYGNCAESTLNGQIATLDAQLDAHGKQDVSVALTPQAKRHQPVTVTVEGIVTNVDRQVIANRATTTVDVGDYYIGVRSTTYFGKVGSAVQASVAALKTDGTWQAGVSLKASLLRWDWPATADSNGNYIPKTTLVATANLRSAAAPVPLSLVPDRPGTYEIRVESTDARGNHIEAGTTSYVLGKGATFGSFDDPSVQLVSSSDTYQVGDTADVLVKSPWPDAEGIVTVERDDIYSYARFTVNGSAAALHLPIAADSVPNVHVSVVLFRLSPAVPAAAGSPGRIARPEVIAGSVSLRVPPVTRRLGVQVSADRAEYRPGSKATVKVAVTDAVGTPAAGSVTLWAVDEGVLRLTGFGVPDVLAQLWPDRPDRVATADARTRILDEAVLTGRLQADGLAKKAAGGANEAADTTTAVAAAPASASDGRSKEKQPGESVTLRTDFRVLAHWVGSVDATGGSATVPIALPQSLTSYRIIAVADSGADRFGGGTSVVEIRQPFMVQPALPRFVAIGDTFEAGAVLQNQSGRPGKASLTLELPVGSPIAIDGPATQTVDLPVGPTEVRFHLRADHLGAASGVLKGSLMGGGTGQEEGDAVQVALPVLVSHRIETVAAAGEVTASKEGAQEVEQLVLPTAVVPDQGGLEITAASSALVGLANGVDYLVEYPYGCLEQRSSRLRALIMLKDLRDQFPLPSLAGERFTQSINAEIARIRNYLTPEGGLAYWEGSTYPDVYLSARVLVLLLDARDVGIDVPSDVIDRVTGFLHGVVENVKSESLQRPLRDVDGVWPNRAHVLYALARAGSPDTDLTAKLWTRRYDLPVLEQLHLLNAMVLSGMTGDRANRLYGELLNSVRVEADQAFLQDDVGREEWNGFVCPCASYLYAADTHDTAEMLSLVVEVDPTNRLAPQMARWLLAQRDRHGRWSNTLENGYALTALVNYYRAAETTPPDLRAEVLLGTTKAFEHVFSGRSLAAEAATVPMASLAPALAGSKVPLSVRATGRGTLFWTARLRYEPAAKKSDALDAGFAVTREYLPYADARGTARAGSSTFAAGALVQVHLTVRTQQARRNVVVDDPIPAGLEPLDARLTSTARTELPGDGANSDAVWSGIDHVEMRDDRVLLFATGLEPGTFSYTYVARATAPGTFIAAPTQAEEMYRPEIFGRTATASMTITPPK